MVWELAAAFAASGLVQGVRHAAEPDHVAAVMTMSSCSSNAKQTVGYATWWGAGHALVLGGLSAALFLFQRSLPTLLVQVLELGVAIALVALGVRALASLRAVSSGAGTKLPHSLVSGVNKRLPLGIGMLHGLAGSGALAACIASQQPSFVAGMLSIALYAIGTMIGMVALAAMLRRPLALGLSNCKARRLLILLSGAFSIALGLIWGLNQALAMAQT